MKLPGNERIPKSSYQERLDEEAELMDSEPTADAGRNRAKNNHNIRYWSDYDRVFYHPRSLHRLPDVPDYENTEGDWMGGQETFTRYNEEHDVMEESFRLFVEECDYLQGIQVTNESSSFGGFTHAFLLAFREEFPKLPSITFSLLSSATPSSIEADDDFGLRRVLGDALGLQGLKELSTMTIPIQSPSSWSPGPWLEDLALDRHSYYHTSALFSSHIETATLPLRLKEGQEDTSKLCSILSWETDARFAHLGGIFPLSDSFDFRRDVGKNLYDFSALPQATVTDSDRDVFSRIDVSRGFSPSHTSSYQSWLETQRLQIRSFQAPAIPLPSSFPSFFTSLPTRPPSCTALSSLSTTKRTSILFSRYASQVDECIKRRRDMIQRMGLEIDDVKSLRDELWVLEDEFKGGESVLNVEMDEDEN
ncbi:unnamed protein product [Somion occarium]|uniref:DML1/Misato tubulin domain-containing protein n=1 Tax=Somion occarium TaxID=3059160 RepID=A0ABP1CTI9_9APHY